VVPVPPVPPVPPPLTVPVAAEPEPEFPPPVEPLFAVPVLPVAPEGWVNPVMLEVWPLLPSHAPNAAPPATSNTAQTQSATIRALLSEPWVGSVPSAASKSAATTTGTSSVFSVSSPTGAKS
jgi:hypothetical protein